MRSILCFLVCLSLLVACITEPENHAEMKLAITLLGDPQCNDSKSAEIGFQTSASQTCMEYAYDLDNQKLILKHHNAAFNCCPDSLWCAISYRNDTLFIQEFEKQMGCKCNCLYDLNLEVTGVEPGKYHLQLIEPYYANQDQLCLDLDLPALKQGNFCVNRTNYPWAE
jgi:hypothetical protein